MSDSTNRKLAWEVMVENRDAHINAAWVAIERGWDIEPRAYFEKEAKTNGFKYPLAMAIHFIWKRLLSDEKKFYVCVPRNDVREAFAYIGTASVNGNAAVERILYFAEYDFDGEEETKDEIKHYATIAIHDAGVARRLLGLTFDDERND